MSDRAYLEELSDLLARADMCSIEYPDGAPADHVAELETDFKAIEQRWVEAVRNGLVPSLDAVHDERQRWRQRVEDMTTGEQSAHFAYVQVARGWFKKRHGDLPVVLPDVRSAVGEAMEWLSDLHQTLTYEQALLRRTTACDCDAAAVAHKAPSGPLQIIGDYTDGYYVGDQRLCPECGAHWFAGILDDSAGSTFWERLK